MAWNDITPPTLNEFICWVEDAKQDAAGDPFDLLTLILAMANAWSPASSVYTAAADDAAAEHERRRKLLRETVARAVAP